MDAILNTLKGVPKHVPSLNQYCEGATNPIFVSFKFANRRYFNLEFGTKFVYTAFTLTQLNQLYLNQFKFNRSNDCIYWTDQSEGPIRKHGLSQAGLSCSMNGAVNLTSSC